MEVENKLLPCPVMDWEQVRLNGGPPCFAVGFDGDPNHFCGRAERWEGHGSEVGHEYISLAEWFEKHDRFATLECKLAYQKGARDARAQQDPDPDLVERAREFLANAQIEPPILREAFVEIMTRFARSVNDEMRERLERIGKELRRIFVDVPMQGTLEGIKRQRDKQIRQIQNLLDREFPE